MIWQRSPSTLALLLAFAAHPASADVPNTLELSARHEVFYDSNIFRAPPTASSSARASRSDTIQTTTLGLLVDKSYSLQRFELDANLVDRRYRNSGYLNFSALDYRANWHWSATPRVRGNLVADRRTRSNSYADVSNTSARNLRTDDVYRLNGEADLGAAVRLIGAVGQRRQSNEQVVLQDRDSKVRSALAGLRYVYPSGSYVGYGLELARGEYLNRVPGLGLATDFDQTEHGIHGNWIWSGKTSVGFSLSHVRRTHTETPYRDYSTPLAEVHMRWAPTGKIRVDAELSQTVIATHTDYASYALRRRVSLMPTWSATAHTTVRLQLDQWNQDFRGGFALAPLANQRDDTTRLARLSLDWRPRDALLVSMQLQTERRSSSFSNFSYRTHGASLAARLRF